MVRVETVAALDGDDSRAIWQQFTPDVLMELLPAAVYVCDRDGTIRGYNRRAIALWGRSPRPGDTHAGFASSFRLYRTDDSPLPYSETPMAAALEHRTPFRNEEVVVERPDGSRITVMVNIDLIRDPSSGEILGAVNVFQDISERKLVECELLRATQAKDEFLGLVSHELRTPLTVLLWISRLLAVRGSTLDPDTIADVYGTLLRATERLRSTVENMLVLARLAHSNSNTEPLHIESLIAAIVASRNSPQHPIEFNRSLVPYVEANPAWISHVVENLISNAREYSPPGAPIAISVERDGDTIRTRVADRGEGIDPAEMASIFEPFFRSSRRETDQKPGAGLGLAVCKRLVAEMGGDISVEARVGGGTEFSFRLPITSCDASPGAS